MAYFCVESTYDGSEFLVKPDEPLTSRIYARGSWEIVIASVMGFQDSYAEFLRYCREQYGAKIKGKNWKYPVPFFQTQQSALLFRQELEKRAAALVRLD